MDSPLVSGCSHDCDGGVSLLLVSLLSSLVFRLSWSVVVARVLRLLHDRFFTTARYRGEDWIIWGVLEVVGSGRCCSLVIACCGRTGGR